MDSEQAANWAAAQREVGVGVDLVPAALRQLQFLAAVDRRRWLYEGPLLDRAIHRYKACWLPLLAKHTQAAVVDGPLVVPLDCEWIWHCHRLNPVQYMKDCKKVYGRILNNDNVESSTQAKSKNQSEKVWSEFYPEEPFELDHTSSSNITIDMNADLAEAISYDLVSAVKRQSSFYYQVGTPTMHDKRFLEEALTRYKGFLYLIKMNQEKGLKRFSVPTYDVDVMWHTHQLHPVTYCSDMLKLLGKVLEHDDTDSDRSEGKKLDAGFTGTTEQFEHTFGVRYWKAAAMYRGNSPSPVTSSPQMFSSDSGYGFDSCNAAKHLGILELTSVEIYLVIVDINNLPSAIPKESVYVWFNKNQPDRFISDGGSLGISTITGKSLGAGFQCEPAGELVLTVMVDQASKKSETLGKVHIPLKELDSKLSLERWFELKMHGGRSACPPISIRVAASSTVPTRAQQVLSMINTDSLSLKKFLLRSSIKDQKTPSWTRFVYDCGTELIRLQIREHKAKNGMVSARELVGVSKSSKKQFQLAEFNESKWTLKNSNFSISHGTGGSLLELKGDNQLIKLYRGRKLEYEQHRCCSAHSEEGSAVTAVKFCAEHPYGKAVALLDAQSKLIMVNEDWFLLPWIAISFLLVDAGGKDGVARLIAGAMAEKNAAPGTDAAAVPEAVAVAAAAAGVAAAAAKCGNCGTACGSGGGTVMASGGGNGGNAESAGCGGGCKGGCAIMEDAKAGGDLKSAGCGSGCGGGGCGGGVLGLMAAGSDAKSGGCGSGCGSGCGGAGGWGAMVKASSTAVGEEAKSGGCGSGCGGGCGSGCGGMLNPSANAVSQGQITKSGGCGSGCGGGCGGMVVEGPRAAGGWKSGGCGSGCGGGCSAMVVEGSRAAGGGKYAGWGAGCGSGCGGMLSASSNAVGQGQTTKSGGCGSGCGGGCGGGIMVTEGSSAGFSA